jgi:DNA helicase-2/ATP-dependent DNA helicase PcrA
MINLSNLNVEQQLAVTTTDGPVLVLAGAGSGKTAVLTHRIAYIVDSGLATPDNILAMTFTNKAANEMKERILKLLGSSNLKTEVRSMPWMGTFHSICVKTLRIYGEMIGLSSNFSIYDSADSEQAVKEAMKKVNISPKEFNPGAVRSYISSAKNELISPEDYEGFAQGYFQQAVARVYPEYQKLLRESNSVDFDDLIMLTIKLLKENTSISSHFKEKFKYILVDEFQDTNHSQYTLIKLLLDKHQNICCVGDDDQSIYAFRGATIKNILNFERDFKDTRIVKLEQNYRSTKTILDASYQVISKNKARKDKKLWTDNHDGGKINIFTARDEIEEADWIVADIISKKMAFDEVAILYRTNAQSRSLEESFISSNIPYKIVGGLRFYDRKEVKDILAYLKTVSNPKDNQSFDRIINVPRRGIGKSAEDEIKEIAVELNRSKANLLVSQEILQKFSPATQKFADLLKRIFLKSEELNLVDYIDYILNSSGYWKMLDDGSSDGAVRTENLKELMTVASKYVDESNEIDKKSLLGKFLEDVSLLEGASEKVENNKKVTLMTVHASKGLEFKNIFVIGMEENLFPHSNSFYNEKDLEEERRLAYVAITRAKENLSLTHALTRKYFGSIHNNKISRFVTDISKDIINHIAIEASDGWSDEVSQKHQPYMSDLTKDLVKGSKVKHEYFGIGLIKDFDDSTITIDFGQSIGIKELMIEYARLKIVK